MAKRALLLAAFLPSPDVACFDSGAPGVFAEVLQYVNRKCAFSTLPVSQTPDSGLPDSNHAVRTHMHA